VRVNAEVTEDAEIAEKNQTVVKTTFRAKPVRLITA
jgi:hypothetical protein